MRLYIFVIASLFSFSLNSQNQFSVLTSNISAEIPNKFLITDSGFYGLYTHCVSFEFSKYTPSKFDIIKYNKYEDKLNSLSFYKIGNKDLKGFQLVDIIQISGEPIILIAKEEKDFILLYKAKLSNLNSLTEIGKLEYTDFTAPNTGRLDRKYDAIQNIYMNKSEDGKSIVFYTYLKNSGKKLNLICFNETLELIWSNQIEIPIDRFFFGQVKRFIVLNNNDVIFNVHNNNEAKCYRYVHSSGTINELAIEIPLYAIRNTELISNGDYIYILNVLEKKLSKEFQGININKINKEGDLIKTINLTEEFSKSKLFECKIVDVQVSESRIRFSIEDNDRETTIINEPLIFFSVDKELESYNFISIPMPLTDRFQNSTVEAPFQSSLLLDDIGLKFLVNAGEEYVQHFHDSKKTPYDKIVDTKLAKYDGEEFIFESIGEFKQNNIVRAVARVSENIILVGYSTKYNIPLKLGLIRF